MNINTIRFVLSIVASVAIGNLIYMMIRTRTNIGHVGGVFNKFMSNLGKTH